MGKWGNGEWDGGREAWDKDGEDGTKMWRMEGDQKSGRAGMGETGEGDHTLGEQEWEKREGDHTLGERGWEGDRKMGDQWGNAAKRVPGRRAEMRNH